VPAATARTGTNPPTMPNYEATLPHPDAATTIFNLKD